MRVKVETDYADGAMVEHARQYPERWSDLSFGGRVKRVGVILGALALTQVLIYIAMLALMILPSMCVQAQSCPDDYVCIQGKAYNVDLTPLIDAVARVQSCDVSGKVAPHVTCGIATIGYRFVGEPGSEFRYAGRTYEIESDGATELIAARKRGSYAIDGRTLPLDVWPRDQFGFREARLPERAP